MSAFVFILLVLSALVTSIISGIFGMAGGILFLSFLTFFLSYSVLIPIHGAVQVMSNASRCFFLWTNVKKEFFVPFTLGAPLGVALVSVFLKEFSDPTLPYLLIAGLIFYVLFKPKRLPALKLGPRGFFLLGIASGGLGMVVGATGPFQAPFYLRDDLTKEEIVATKASTQTVTHLFKFPAFFWLGFSYLDHIWLIAALTLAVIAGSWIGVNILKNMKSKWFFTMFQIFLFLAAIRLLYLVFFSP